MIFLQIPVGPMKNFTYLIGDEVSAEAAVVDPSWDVDKVLDLASKRGLKIRYVLNTHSHHDHCSGNDKVTQRTGAYVLATENTKVRSGQVIRDGDILNLGSVKIKVIYTPGHSPDGTCFLTEGKLLTGDTLFVGECGRTDLGGGDAGALYDSLFNKILHLDDSMEVYPGHDYGEKPSSTIGHERATNYTLKPRSREDFMEFMKAP